MAPRKIGIVGASGETGLSIVNGLLEAGGVHIIALTRPASMSKPANKTLSSRGVELRSLDLDADHADLVSTLKDIGILISAVGPFDQLIHIPLATAAKSAGVSRFLPCAAMPVMPAGGLHQLRDPKEQVFNHIKQLYLPYTVVDVGWWYQICFPRLPSGKVDYAIMRPELRIAGTGEVGSALTDLRDVGRYVARIVEDERTVNKYVLVYNEMWTKNAIFTVFSLLAGEEIPRTYDSADTIEEEIAAAKVELERDPGSVGAAVKLWGAQYQYSWGIRGDNTPEHAKYLGYLTSKELYPEMGFTGLEAYLQEVIEGKAPEIYVEKKKEYAKAMSEGNAQ